MPNVYKMSNVEHNFERLFHWIDYVVFVFSLVVSAAIGIYHGFRGKKQSSVGEFLMGDRKMSLLPVALSMQATFLSAIFLLGVPAEIYTFGSMYLANCIGHAIAIPIVAHLFVPIFRRRRLMISAHEVGYYYCYSVDVLILIVRVPSARVKVKEEAKKKAQKS